MARKKHRASAAPLSEYIHTYRLSRADLRTLAHVTDTSLEALTGLTPAPARKATGTAGSGGARGRTQGRAAKK